MSITFTKSERRLVEEAFREYLKVVTIIARLHDVEGEALSKVQVLQDLSGITLPEENEKEKE